MFSALAIAPAIIVAVFSALFFNLGIQAWFNDRIRTALDRSIAISEAYARDHREFIRADILSMAATLNRQDPRRLALPQALSLLLQELADDRSLTEALILRGDGEVLARSKLSFVLEFDPLPNAALQRAAAGEVVIMTSDTSDRVRALARIDALIGGFLYVGRFADSTVLNHVARLSDAVSDYRDLDPPAFRHPDHLHPVLRHRFAAAADGGGVARPRLRQPDGPADLDPGGRHRTGARRRPRRAGGGGGRGR